MQRVRRRYGVIHAPTGVRGGYATYFLRAYAGAPVAQTLRLSLLRYGERLYDTLKALPENVATPYAYWSKRAVLSMLRWRDNTAPFAVCFSLPLSPGAEEIFEKYS